MKIFISGIAGFLGSHIADAMISEGHDVIGCDNMIGGYMDNVPKKAEFHKVGAENFKEMNKLLKGVDIVYHIAAAPYEGLSVFSPNLVNQHTYMTTVSLLSASAQNKVKRFVFTSSMARYGNAKIPFKEEYPANPVDPYGIAKVASEMQIKNICETHGLDYVIAAPHNIIGPRQKYDDPYRNVVSIFINRMLQGKQPVIYGDGEQKRCFSFINDCLYCLTKLKDQKNVVGEIINIGPDEEFVTMNELAQRTADLLNFKLKPIYVPDRPKEVRLATSSADKARKLLGYKTTYTLDQGLKEMIDYIKKRGPKPFKYHLDLEIINEKTPRTWVEKII